MHPQDTIAPEEWRPVVGWEDWYSVSNLGRIRREAPGRRTYPGRICKQSYSRGGYPCVGLCRGSHDSLRRLRVHQLVAVAFIGSRPEGTGINHRNGIKTDNRPENLEWMTPGDNSRHAAAMGLLATGARQGANVHPETRPRGDQHHAKLHPERLARGERAGSARLNEAAVRDILTSPLSSTALAAKYGVVSGTIDFVRQRKTWRHVVI